jgi:ATPase subunit of ABC transporter with duplicated ATPase domains
VQLLASTPPSFSSSLSLPVDLDAVIWLGDHLSREFKGTLLLVSHDADFLAEVCSDVILLEGERLHHHHGDFSQVEQSSAPMR